MSFLLLIILTQNIKNGFQQCLDMNKKDTTTQTVQMFDRNIDVSKIGFDCLRLSNVQ